ncbi:MAG: flagellar hook-associated protein FlgK [candidate division Zixibacteria bacterium]|nr:flagellar hook-associated protein FlgK [candidate division Zixibacteria bacterium]
MAGLFQALEIGKRALLSHQFGLQTIGHNIANVNTPGFSRQRVQITSTYPETTTLGIVGTGVQVYDIQRIQDLFLGQQFREDNKLLGQWRYKEKVMDQVESLVSEPNDNTLSDLLNKFWDSWADLSTNPNSVSSRVAILEQANLVVNSFHQTAKQLDALRDSVDRDLVNVTEEINRLSKEIGNLNEQIKSMELGGVKANDLRDARDLLLDQLSEYIDVNTIEQKNGGMTVFIGAMALVDGPDHLEIASKVLNRDGRLEHELVWKGTDVKISNLNGQLKGLIDSRDRVIPSYMEELDVLARTIIEEVNALHRSGYGLNGTTGVNFFETSLLTAAGIRINPDLASDPARIAASLSGEVGDNRIALAINDLRNRAVMVNGSTTINDYYNGFVGQLGMEAREARSFTKNYELLLNQTENARQAVQGVSLDEEMANMVRSQHAYDAAARVITTIDQALDTVISKMGIVGR